jgi:trans-aconitate 2-methyltransferase
VTLEGPHPSRYTFGDTDLAARRLELLAEVLDPTSQAFLRRAAPAAPRLAVDLGCGPGLSTRLLAEATRARRAVGVDGSAAYVRAAASRYPAHRFAQGDVTVDPLPVTAPDVLYARLVLAHLPAPAEQARRWAAGLAPGGRLCLEEMEWIEADDPVLAEYEERVLAVVEHQGAPMYAGPLLAPLVPESAAPPAWTAVRTVVVPTATAARI